MANFTVRDAAPAYLGAAMFFQPGATRTSNSPTLARYTNPSGSIVELQTVGGTFGAGGVPTGGTVVGATLFAADTITQLADFSDLAVPLTTFDSAWLGPNPMDMFALLLSGVDTIAGGAADDSLVGHAGDDQISGGGGVNVAAYAGKASDYVITDLGGGGTTIAGPDGTDTLSDIQLARFSDGLVGLVPDAPAAFTINALSGANTEGTAATFTILNTGGTQGTHKVNWAVIGNAPSAASADDFPGGLLPFGSVVFNPGDTSRTITVATNADSTVEPDEGFTVTISQTVGTAVFFNTNAAGTIISNDAEFSIAAQKVSNPEGTGGTTPFIYTVTRTGALAAAQSVSYSVAGSVNFNTVPAVAADFANGVFPTGSVNFAIGQKTQTITVGVKADTLGELNEAFLVTLSDPPPGAVFGKSYANGITLNDDISFSVSAPIPSVAEGTGFTKGSLSFVVTRSGTQSGTNSVWINTFGTGAAPAKLDDFVFNAGFTTAELSFAPGQTSRIIKLDMVPDSDFEPNEQVMAQLFDPSKGTTIATATAIGTIVNDETAMSIAASRANRTKGTGGTTAFTFTVSRHGNTKFTDNVQYAVAGTIGTGTVPAAASDFAGGVLPSGTVTFVPGETRQTITINVNADALAELNERFAVTLSGPNNGVTLLTNRANGIITNDDTSLSISAANASRPEGGTLTTSFATFTVTRSGLPTASNFAKWTVTGGGRSGVAAASASDFAGGVMPSGTVSFAVGETKKTISVPIQGDTLVESDEAFTVTLSALSLNTAIATATATGTILDDDAIYVSGDGTFSGTAGADVFIIGAGTPTVTGFGGVDRYIFLPSALGSGNHSTLTDFSRAAGERIDVSRIDAYSPTRINDAFIWEGQFSLTDSKTTSPGHLSFRSSLIFGYDVRGNIDDDTDRELYFRVPSTSPLAAADFIL